MVIVGSLDYCNPDVDPVGRELRHYCRRPSLRAGRPHRGLRSRPPALCGLLPAEGSAGADLRWSGASPLGGCLGPSAPLGQDGPQGAGPPTVPTGRANLQDGTVSVPGACQSIPEAPRRVGGPRRIAGGVGERPFVTISSDDCLSGDIPVAATPAQGGEQHHAHQSGRQCETPGSACPEPRDAPPFRPAAIQAGRLHPRTCMGRLLPRNQNRFAEGPAVTG